MSAQNYPMQLMHYTTSAGWTQVDARVIGEASLSMSVNGLDWLSFQCTPTAQEDLALGFLYNEGIINSLADIADIQLCPDETHIDIWTNRAVTPPQRWTRTSGCGSGATNAEMTLRQIPVIPQSGFTPEKLLMAMSLLQENQDIYKESGGIHCSAISDGQTLLHRSEDIGRHNTLDKLAGQILRQGTDTSAHILLTTGRISTEMLQKAARLGAPVVVSRTSPTSGSVQLAERAGITLAGYARRERITVYTHPERLGLS